MNEQSFESNDSEQSKYVAKQCVVVVLDELSCRCNASVTVSLSGVDHYRPWHYVHMAVI